MAMTKAFEDFMDSWKESLGVLSSHPTKEVDHAGGTGAVANRKPPTLSLRTEPELTGQEHGDLPEPLLIADRRQVAMASANAADRPMKPGNDREIRQDRIQAGRALLEDSCGDGRCTTSLTHHAERNSLALMPERAERGLVDTAGIDCAQVHNGDTITALDALAGSVLAVNRERRDWLKKRADGEDKYLIGECLLSYICAGPDCGKIVYASAGDIPACELCGQILCLACLQEHMEAGHVSDADTAREMERSR